jgi:acetyl esterase/lipase
MLIARLALVAFFVFAFRPTSALTAEPDWKPIPIDAKFSAWRESEHPGWTLVGDATLREGAGNRLSGKPGEGVLLSRGDTDLYTREEYQDVELKLEFMVPAGSNSGIKLNGLYEIQIRDTAGKSVDQLTGDDLGGIYPRAELGPPYEYLDKGVPPRVNAAKRAGEWQSLEIAFRSPRFDASDKKTEDARFVRVVLNGETIHENVAVECPTGAAWDEQPEVPRGPLMLQGNHGPVAFRNMQVRLFADAATPAAASAPADDSASDARSASEPLKGIPYVEDGHPNQVLNLYRPAHTPTEGLPLVIWIHGGAWLGGSHENPSALFLLEEGFAVASIQYRFSSHGIWPAQAHDCKAAVRFLRASAAKYNLDADRFAVGGESAGGHLAAFLGTSGDVTELEGDLGNAGVSSRVQAVVDLFGPTDLTLTGQQSGPGSMLDHDAPNSPESLLMGGPILQRRELAKTANPLTYVDKSDAPFLILHGDHDQVVPLAQSEILAKALGDVGVEVTMKALPGAGHGGPQFNAPENRQLITEFLTRHLQAGE